MPPYKCLLNFDLFSNMPSLSHSSSSFTPRRQKLTCKMQVMSPCRGYYGRHLEVFDPFSHYFWDDCPFEIPFRAPFVVLLLPFILSTQPCIRSKIEYKETPEAHLFMAELLGLKKEGVKVHVYDGNVLHVTAKSKHEMEEKKDNYCHVEHRFGEFVSSFKLPHTARPELIQTSVENGFLTVTAPKQKVDIVESHHHHKYY